MNRAIIIFIGSLLMLTGCSYQPKSTDGQITIEVAIFEGGYGLDWHRSIARQYEKLHPNISINLWGDPRVDEKLKPRVLRRNPPDIASSSLPFWKLVVANKLYPLNEELYTAAYGQNMSWRDTIQHGVLADNTYEGKVYAVPTNLSAWVCWYDKKQFDAHGWKVPADWGEFMKLCAQIKADGVAPLAFQGKYPIYAWAVLLSLYQRLVPLEQWYEMQDLKPGAFTSPEFIHAARLIQEMSTKYYENGALAMTHTESQLEWVNGRAAMCFCGLWLKNEMKNATPAGFEMRCFAVPPVEGGKGDPHAVYAGGAEQFFVFSEAQHPKEAADFLKFMLSKDSAHSYIQKLDTLSPVIDSVKGITISPELKSAVDVLDASTRIFSDRLSGLYLEFAKNDLPDALSDLVSGKSTPEQFGTKLENAVERVRRNPEIYKPATMGVPK